MQTVEDSINGQPITIVIQAPSRTIATRSSWWDRLLDVNSHLRKYKASHLLKLVEADNETWYAGESGISLAAGIEMLALRDESLHDSVLVLPLDERIYWANLNGRVVTDEGAPYPGMSPDLVRDWRESGKTVVLLANGGKQKELVDVSADRSIDFDVDENEIRFQRAATSLPIQGLFRFTDAIVGVSVIAVFTIAALTHEWVVEKVPEIDVEINPIAFMQTQVQEEPLRSNATYEVMALANAFAHADRAKWRMLGVTGASYDSASRLITLHGRYSPETWTATRRFAHELSASSVDTDFGVWSLSWTPTGPASVPVAETNATIHDLLRGMTTDLREMGFETSYARPEELRNGAYEAQVKVEGDMDVFQLHHMAAELRVYPVQMDLFTCDVTGFRLASCEVSFRLRGSKG